MPAHPTDPAAVKIVRKVVEPIRAVFQTQARGGLILVLSALVALVWANSPAGDVYEHLLHTELALSVGGHALNLHLSHWINDALMALFFFVVGLEIKREVLSGELSSPRQAALPIAAAIGGVLVPAGIYALVNAGTPTAGGWGIPMATDIAFALGVLALLGGRVPLWMVVFLTALAIVDDLMSVLVIAAFYTPQIHTGPLMVAFGAWAFVLVMNLRDVRSATLYMAGGAVMWVAMHESGIHATIAGVLMGLSVPASPRIDRRRFIDEVGGALAHYRRVGLGERVEQRVLDGALHSIHHASTAIQPPSYRLEHALHAPVAYVILPIFALANAGVAVSAGDAMEAAGTHCAIGVVLGLLVGKPLGIWGASWIAVKLGVADLPKGARWSQLFGAAVLGGIGFTMSLFVTGLAFSNPDHITPAKIGILGGSLVAAVVGLLILRKVLPPSGQDRSESAQH
ncbi:MAG: Na+/H+ antiporter NhaA [Myxococcales bacterium]|nr:Na+/H+ antiporter NhaA [Myxococcales bacterium]